MSPPQAWRAAAIHTYDDHRMAMCFALAAFNPAGVHVRIEDPRCVAKTFPDFFEALFAVARTSTPHIPVICVDGPTASGKGTLASDVARRLGYHYLDSGALYRITGLTATRAGLALDPQHEHTIARMAEGLAIVFIEGRVLLDGHAVRRHPHRGSRHERLTRCRPCPPCARRWSPCSRASASCPDWWPTGATWAP